MFHVKHRSRQVQRGRARRHSRRFCRVARRAQIRPRRLRACAARSVMAAGVIPSIRAACPSVRGRTGSSFALISFDRPGNAVEIEPVIKEQPLIPPKCRDVGALSVEIDGIGGICFDAFAQSRRNRSEFRPDRAQDRPIRSPDRTGADKRVRRTPSRLSRDAVPFAAPCGVRVRAIADAPARRRSSAWPLRNGVAPLSARHSRSRCPCRSGARRRCRRAG